MPTKSDLTKKYHRTWSMEVKAGHDSTFAGSPKAKNPLKPKQSPNGETPRNDSLRRKG